MTRTEPLINQAVTWLYTEDLAKMVPFYRDVMELPLVLEQQRCTVFRMAPGAFIGVCNISYRPLGTKGMMVTFLTADVQALYDRLLAKGVTFEHEPKPLGDGSLIGTFFRDPQGYHLQIQQFLDPRWPAAETIR